MLNEIWSKKVQGILTLDLSREARFRDDKKEMFIKTLGLKPGMTVVELGCGPGALSRKLALWLGLETNVIGIDRDTNFIEYAQEKAKKLKIDNISYKEDDALSINLLDSSVDSCVSHTLVEHVPNRAFLLEQKRICRSGGIVSVMYCRPDKYVRSIPSEIPKISDIEKELWTKLNHAYEDMDKAYNVGAYLPNEYELPRLFDELGFTDVKIDAITIPVSIDDARNSIVDKIKLIEMEKIQLLERIEMSLRFKKEITDGEVIKLKDLIDNRFLERMDLVSKGIKIWDYTIVYIQVVSGIVEK